MKVLIILGIFLLVMTAGCTSTLDDSMEEQQTEKRYMNDDLDSCRSLVFTCDIGEQPFYDENGCGCVK